MSLTLVIGKLNIQDLDNATSKSCYVEINHGKQSIRTSSINFDEKKGKDGYVANFSQLLELLVLILLPFITFIIIIIIIIISIRIMNLKKL